jgi:hypothetical protein
VHQGSYTFRNRKSYLSNLVLCAAVSWYLIVASAVYIGFGADTSFTKYEDRKTNKVQQLDVCSHPTTQRPTTSTNHIQHNQNNTPNAVTGPLFS